MKVEMLVVVVESVLVMGPLLQEVALCCKRAVTSV
jgi:hypothetical protein